MSKITISLTGEEQMTLRKAAFGAVTLLTLANPGVISTTRESIVGAKILTGATGQVGQILADNVAFKLEGESAAEIAHEVLPALASTIATLKAKAPDDAEEFRRIVLTAVEQAAGTAKDGPSRVQQEMIAKISKALGA